MPLLHAEVVLLGARRRRASRRRRRAARRRRVVVVVALGVRALAAEHREVLDLDLRRRRLVRLLVLADGGEEARVHVRVGEEARAGEELLDVGLRRQVARRLLEDHLCHYVWLPQRVKHS